MSLKEDHEEAETDEDHHVNIHPHGVVLQNGGGGLSVVIIELSLRIGMRVETLLHGDTNAPEEDHHCLRDEEDSFPSSGPFLCRF